jgi:hypothetical protein
MKTSTLRAKNRDQKPAYMTFLPSFGLLAGFPFLTSFQRAIYLLYFFMIISNPKEQT